MLSHYLPSDVSHHQSATLPAPAQRQQIFAKADPKSRDGARLDRYHLSTLRISNTLQATMTLNIFSDTDFCLACEKPLKRSGQ